MKIERYKRRIVDDKIEHYLKLFGAVCIEGPKYCGKTWAERYHSNFYKTTDELSNNVKYNSIFDKIISILKQKPVTNVVTGY